MDVSQLKEKVCRAGSQRSSQSQKPASLHLGHYFNQVDQMALLLGALLRNVSQMSTENQGLGHVHSGLASATNFLCGCGQNTLSDGALVSLLVKWGDWM